MNAHARRWLLTLAAACWLGGGPAAAVLRAAPKEDHAMKLSSPVLTEGQPIPARFTCEGNDVSPLLEWSEPPPGTVTFALICDDPDAPGGTWVHWVVYGLPASARGLPEACPATEESPGGGRQGMNDFRRVGYGGPCPPPGRPHRYFFRLYALDADLPLGPRATRPQVDRAMQGHILAETRLMGTYRRGR